MLPYKSITITIPLSITNAVASVILFASLVAIITIGVKIIWRLVNKNEILKYEFVTIIAHKFRTPLTYMKWAVDELIGAEQDTYKRENLEGIRESNEKLIKLTGTLVELTDKDSSTGSLYNMERVSLCEFVRTIGNMYKDFFHEKNIFFSVNCPPEEIIVKIDRLRMEFVLQTLLENAHTYTPPGKNVEVKVGLDRGKATFSVTDGGIGIAKEDLSNIFTKFFRAENARASDTEGFGVGLYLARSIVERHKGRIEVSSPGMGLGATFTVTLRRAK